MAPRERHARRSPRQVWVSGATGRCTRQAMSLSSAYGTNSAAFAHTDLERCRAKYLDNQDGHRERRSPPAAKELIAAAVQ